MWFTENAWPPMLIAGIAGLICVALWNADRNSRYLVGAVICLLLTGGLYAVERAVVTEGERLQDDVSQMCDQFRRRQPETLNHFSDSATDLRTLCDTAMKMVEIEDDLRLTDFQTKFSNNHSRADVHFRANATISVMSFRSPHPFRGLLTYQKEGGQWKIVGVQRLDVIRGDKIEIMAPR